MALSVFPDGSSVEQSTNLPYVEEPCLQDYPLEHYHPPAQPYHVGESRARFAAS